jgi:DNA-directed RNA polymerase II subunit RPB2
MEDYFRKYGYCRAQLDGFDRFVGDILTNILHENTKFTVASREGVYEHEVQLVDVRLTPPTHVERDGKVFTCTPHTARLRRLTYAMTVICKLRHDEVKYGQSGGERVVLDRVSNEHVTSFKMPCMVRSSLCVLSAVGWDDHEDASDAGGYFIINGHEKCLISQQKLCINRIYIFQTKAGLVAEIRSCHRTKWRSTSTLRLMWKGDVVVAHIPFVSRTGTTPLNVPFETLQRALDGDVAAVNWVKTNSTAASCPLDSEVLPHLGLTGDARTRHKKVAFLKKMRRRLIGGVCDDRDSQSLKRVDGAGPSIGVLFRQIYRATMKQVRLLCRRLVDAKERFVNLGSALDFNKLTGAVRYHFSTGNWSLNKGVNTGVVQLLTRTSALAKRSHLNRINVPINRDGKATPPRLLHESTYGVLCPSESPEGASCGLMNNKSVLTHVGLGLTADMRRNILVILTARCGLRPEHTPPLPRNNVLLCGDIIGCVDDAPAAAELMRKMKAIGTLPFDSGVAVVDGDVHLMLQPGRCVRPMRVRGVAPSQWGFDEYDGSVVYLDKVEENLCGGKYDEISPYAFLGETVACIPFSDHNQAPRNMYQASMAKQAIGVPSMALGNTYCAQQYVLHTPQSPLVTTEFDRMANDVPTTISCVVAIATCGGWNQEDSIVVDRAAIERGLAAVTYYTTKTTSLSNNGKVAVEAFERPGPDTSGRIFGSRYDSLDADGMPRVGALLKDGDCIIGKTAHIAPQTVCRSVVFKDKTPARVDSVVRYADCRGNDSVTVRLRRTLPLLQGDKMSSRHGQKGTIGRLVNHEDMPFCPRTGITPDLILNPHCIPSRMTIGQILEMITGKAAALSGVRADGTPFRKLDVGVIEETLRRYGYEPKGKETLISGKTGLPLQVRVFMGVCAYQRLRHIASMKIHSRGGAGAVSILTRQPLEGRSRNGGLRFGEVMFRCVIKLKLYLFELLLTSNF